MLNKQVPIRLVRSEDLGLRGAHVVASRLLSTLDDDGASQAIKNDFKASLSSSELQEVRRPARFEYEQPIVPSRNISSDLLIVGVTSFSAALIGAGVFYFFSRRFS